MCTKAHVHTLALLSQTESAQKEQQDEELHRTLATQEERYLKEPIVHSAHSRISP